MNEYMDLESGDVMKEFLSLVNGLEKLGLTTYEARAYVAMVALKKGSAETVARTARIPRTSAYKVLESLAEKGFVQSIPGRPVIFVAEDPDRLAALLVKEIESVFDRLAFLRDMTEYNGVPQLVYTVMGEENVMEKLADILDMAEERVIISTPVIGEMRKRLGKHMSRALKRGVEITIITAPLLKTPPNTRVVRRKGLIATDVVADGKYALLAAPDLSACGYTDDPSLALHFEQFLNIMMGKEA